MARPRGTLVPPCPVTPESRRAGFGIGMDRGIREWLHKHHTAWAASHQSCVFFEGGAGEKWALFMLTAVEATGYWTPGRIFAIRDLFDQSLTRYRAGLPPKV